MIEGAVLSAWLELDKVQADKTPLLAIRCFMSTADIFEVYALLQMKDPDVLRAS